MLSVWLQGKFYLVIEELSQLFRSLVPIQLWYKYIMGDDASNSYFLGGVLIVLYSLCKVRWPGGGWRAGLRKTHSLAGPGSEGKWGARNNTLISLFH